jgi:hypothetical protein
MSRLQVLIRLRFPLFNIYKKIHIIFHLLLHEDVFALLLLREIFMFKIYTDSSFPTDRGSPYSANPASGSYKHRTMKWMKMKMSLLSIAIQLDTPTSHEMDVRLEIFQNLKFICRAWLPPTLALM